MRKPISTNTEGLFVPATNLATHFPRKNNLLAKQLRWVFAVVLLLSTTAGFGQLSGIKTVGNVGLGDNYGSLTAAFNAIQSNTLNGDIVLQLTANYNAANESSFPIYAPTKFSIGNYHVKVYPTASGLSISGNSAIGILSLFNTKNITIDGRVNATGTTNDLVISNNNITTGSAIQFINDAVYNTITYCNVRGGATETTGFTTSGVILFGTASLLGNSNNTISQCDIRDAGKGFPQVAIQSAGTVAYPNKDNTVTANNIANFWHSNLNSSGIYLGAGTTKWIITDNSLFQSAPRISTAGVNDAVSYAINIYNNSGDNFTVAGNYIGGSAPNCIGKWEVTGTGRNEFYGISTFVSYTVTSNIDNNTIKNFSITTFPVSTRDVWTGIAAYGKVNVGTNGGNTIGETTGTGSITLTVAQPNVSDQKYLVSGIQTTGASSVINISNNKVGSITTIGNRSGGDINPVSIQGIIAYNSANITNNLVGSTVTANSINASTPSKAGSQMVAGIYIPPTGGSSYVIDGNTVANINQASPSGSSFLKGIVIAVLPGSNTQGYSITNNTVYNLTGSATQGYTSPAYNTPGNEAVSGISMSIFDYSGSYYTAYPITISGNTVHGIIGNKDTALQYQVAGIAFSVTNRTIAKITGNKIYDIRNASTKYDSTKPSFCAGILHAGQYYPNKLIIANNMITLGYGSPANMVYGGIVSINGAFDNSSFYFNSIKIMGSTVSGKWPSYGFYLGSKNDTCHFKNNLIDNARTGGTGKHYAIGFNYLNSPSYYGLKPGASNNNILNAIDPNAVVSRGYSPVLDYSFAGFRTLFVGDSASHTAVPVTFQDPSTGDLHINMGATPGYIESFGDTVIGYTTDYDNQIRPGTTTANGGGVFPDVGADEFDGAIVDLTPPTIAYQTLDNAAVTNDRLLVNFARITEPGAQTGVNINIGTRPRIYYKRSADADTFIDNTPATNGWKYAEANGSSSPFSFSIDYTRLFGGSGVAGGQVIQYFVVAQDKAVTPNPNVGISAGTFNTIPTSVNLVAANFPIGGAINSFNVLTGFIGSINVGAGETITSLTNPGGLFDSLNNSILTGDLVANITSDLTAETGTVALNELKTSGAGGYTLTIQPTGVPRIISGTPSTPSLIKLNGTDRVTINGSINGAGNDRSLSIINSSLDYQQGNIIDNCVIHVSSPGLNNGATNNTIKNCIISGLSNLGTHYAIIQGGADAGGNLSPLPKTPNSNNTYQNNAIFGANYAIYLNGAPTTPDQNTVITKNTIGSTAASMGLYYAGVFSQNEINMQITNNEIHGVEGTLGTYYSIAGIFINSLSKNLVIWGNNITNIRNNGGGAAGIRLGASGVASNNMLIANNSITNITAPASTGGTPTESNNGYGITVVSGSGYKIYYNSVNLTVGRAGSTSAALFTTNAVNSGSIDLRNNCFANSQTANNAFAIYVSGSSNIFSSIDRNMYYCAKPNSLGYIAGTALTTLAAWKAATGMDAYSLSSNPLFSTPTDLTPLSGSPLYGVAIPIAGITTDQNGFTRSATTPSIGAYELPCRKTTSIVFVNICHGTSYNFNGTTLTISGTYYDTLPGANTCGLDSLITLNLTVLPVLQSMNNLSICNNQLPYAWNGLIFTTGGTKIAKLNSVDGCDSTATLTLTIKQTTASTTNFSICPAALPYRWNGLIFTAAGTQSKTFVGGNANGCDSIATLVLTVKANTSSTNNVSVCSNQLPYVWNGVTLTAAGSQTVHIPNAAGCDSAATINLTVNLASTSDTTVSVCNSYFWHDSTYTVSGDYVWHTTNTLGCDSAVTLHLTILAVSSTFTKTDITCFGASNGSLTVTPGSGIPPYTYRLGTTGVYGSANTFSNLPPGTYIVSILDGTGCSGRSDTIIILEPTALTLAVTKTDITCFGSSTGSVIVTASGGVPPYTYRFGTGAFGTVNSFAGLQAGVYTADVKDANGCITPSGQITIGGAQAAITTSFSKTDASCYGSATGSVIVQVNGGVPPYTYRLGITGSYGSSNTFTTVRAGTYNVYIIDANGCAATTANIVIGQPPAVTVSFTQTDAACYGSATGSITVTPTSGVTPFTYRLGTSGSYSPSNSFTSLRSGTYTVSLLDANGCAGTSAPITIGQQPAITGTFTKTDAGCYGSATGSLVVTATSGQSPYQYKLGANGTYGAANAFSSLRAGSYDVYILDNNGCTGVVNVTVGQSPVVTGSIATTDVTCNGTYTGSFTVTPTTGTAPYLYQFGTTGGYGASNTFNNLRAGNYTLFIKDANSCVGNMNVPITEPTVVGVTLTSQDPACHGAGTGSITATGTGGTLPYTYRFGSVGSYSSNNSFTGLGEGLYRVYVLDANNCGYSASATLVQPTAISVTATKTDEKCQGSKNGSITATASGGTPPYLYRLGSTGSFVSTNTFTNLRAGNYSVYVKDANGCVAAITQEIVTENPPITYTFTKTDGTCDGSVTGSLTVNGTGGVSPYLYRFGTTGSFTTTNSFTNLRGGSYVVFIQDAVGCTAVTSSIVIGPVSNITGTFTIQQPCYGDPYGSITVTPTSGIPPFFYRMDVQGQGFQVSNVVRVRVGTLATGHPHGLYIMDSSGCISGRIPVLIRSRPQVTGTYTKTPSCENVGTGSVTITPTVGTPPFYGFGDSTRTAFHIENLRGTSYRFAFSDSFGCVSNTFYVQVDKRPSVTGTVNTSNVTCLGLANGAITVNPTTGFAPYMYKTGARPYQPSNVIGSLRKGTYKIFIQDSTSCVGTINVTVTEPAAKVSATYTVTNTSIAGTYDGAIKMRGVGGTPPYQFRFGTSGAYSNLDSFTRLREGAYRVFIKDANDCGQISYLITVAHQRMPGSLQDGDSYAKGTTPGNMRVTLLNATLRPNPSNGQFTLVIQSEKTGAVQVRVMDINGRVVYAAQGSPAQPYRFGDALNSGVYLVEVRQGDEVKTIKAVKIN